MKQVPGVADAVADTLMTARPFDSNAAFLEALAEHISAEQLEGAAYFLKE